MSKQETTNWPMLPMLDASAMDWEGNQAKAKEAAEGIKAEMKAFWEKGIDFQKSSIDGGKDQYDQFFAFIQETMDNFAEALPEEMPVMPCLTWMPWIPELTKTPKAFRESMKEWEDMANAHFKEQMDSLANFVIQSQEKACAQIPEATEAAEEKGEVIEVKAEAK